MNRCEDYPCCGHTDGLGCGWTYTPEARAYDIKHAYCDHEAGFCDAYDYDSTDDDCDGDINECPHGGCGECDPGERDDLYMEDQWLDGSYEE